MAFSSGGSAVRWNIRAVGSCLAVRQRAQTITLSDNQDIGQFRLTVSFTTPAMKTDLRVVARAENLYAETLLPLTVVTDRNEAPPD